MSFSRKFAQARYESWIINETIVLIMSKSVQICFRIEVWAWNMLYWCWTRRRLWKKRYLYYVFREIEEGGRRLSTISTFSCWHEIDKKRTPKEMCHQLTFYWNLFQSFFSKEFQISDTTAVLINKTPTLKTDLSFKFKTWEATIVLSRT